MKNALTEKFNQAIKTIKTALQHEYASAVLLTCGFICWFFGLTNFLVYSFVSVFVLTLILCDDVKNIYSMVFFVAFFITDITGEKVPWPTYITAISSAVVALICFLVKNVILNKNQIKLGGMFLAFIFAGVAFLIGGIARFNYLAFIVTLGLFVATYILYFIIINFTNNFKDYFIKLFIFASFLLCFELLIASINGGVFDIEDPKKITVLGTQHVNVLSEYFFIGIVCAFVYGLGKKYDFILILLAILFEVGIFFTRCRTMYILSALFFVVMFIIAVIKSPNKIWLLIGAGVIAVLGVLFIIVKKEFINALLEPLYAKMEQQNGREILWPWCFEKFKQYPLFGYGFVADEYIPTTYNNYLLIVLAHNTILQWLTSLGVVGTALITYFYLVKYKIAFKNLNLEKFLYVLSIVGIGLSGLVDQAPSMDFFMFFIPLAIIASIEKSTRLGGFTFS